MSRTMAMLGGQREPEARDVVGRYGGEAEEASELAEVAQDVSNGSTHAGARLEVVSLAASPSEEPREERPRAAYAELEVLVRADDARELRLALDGVDLADDVERRLRFEFRARLTTAASRRRGAGRRCASWGGGRCASDVRELGDFGLRWLTTGAV